MYTLEQKQLAVETYHKLKSLRKTIYCLGYPGSCSTLQLWINEYNTTGQISRKTYKRVKNKYTDEQINFAVNYCVQNEMNITKTCKELGYPCQTVLSKWLGERIPNIKKSVSKGSNLRKYSYNDKIVASIRFVYREGSITEIVKDTGINRSSLNKWKKQLIPLGEQIKMTDTDIAILPRLAIFLNRLHAKNRCVAQRFSTKSYILSHVHCRTAKLCWQMNCVEWSGKRLNGVERD